MHTTTDGKPQVGVARKIQFVNNYNDHKTIIYFFALYLFSRDGNQVNDSFFSAVPWYSYVPGFTISPGAMGLNFYNYTEYSKFQSGHQSWNLSITR